MGKVIRHDTEIDLGVRVRVLVDGVEHTGEVVRCGNTRSWGHMISEQTQQRIEFKIDEDGFEILE